MPLTTALITWISTIAFAASFTQGLSMRTKAPCRVFLQNGTTTSVYHDKRNRHFRLS